MIGLVKKIKINFFLWVLIALGAPACSEKPTELRVGYSPNLTHAQALVGVARGDFKAGVVFNAGPSIIEALFAQAIDVAYVGPVPAINSFIRSKGEYVVIAGATRGGAALVVAEDSPMTVSGPFDNKPILTPQLGNTQDVTARAFFLEKGLTDRRQGGTLALYPVSNPDQINLFRKKDVEAAWTVEPWVSRLVHETGARVLLEESDLWDQWIQSPYSTTVVVARRSLLEEKPALLQKFLQTHVRLTAWIQTHPADAQKICNQQLETLQGKPLPQKTLTQAWDRLDFNWWPVEKSLNRNAAHLAQVGFLRDDPNIQDLLQLDSLRQVL